MKYKKKTIDLFLFIEINKFIDVFNIHIRVRIVAPLQKCVYLNWVGTTHNHTCILFAILNPFVNIK